MTIGSNLNISTGPSPLGPGVTAAPATTPDVQVSTDVGTTTQIPTDASAVVGADPTAQVQGLTDFNFDTPPTDPTVVDPNCTDPTGVTPPSDPTQPPQDTPVDVSPPSDPLPSTPPSDLTPVPSAGDDPPPVDCPPGIHNRKFSTKGDPHETTGDGLHFDNQLAGTFTKLKSASGDLVLQTTQAGAKAKYNIEAALKLGNDVINVVAKGHEVQVNGQSVPYSPGNTVQLPDGGSIQFTAKGLHCTSPAGDVVDIGFSQNHLNITGELNPNRAPGEVKGELGNFDDGNKKDDLVGPDGKQYTLKDKKAFLESWRTQPGDDILLNFGGGVAPDKPGHQPKPHPAHHHDPKPHPAAHHDPKPHPAHHHDPKPHPAAHHDPKPHPAAHHDPKPHPVAHHGPTPDQLEHKAIVAAERQAHAADVAAQRQAHQQDALAHKQAQATVAAEHKEARAEAQAARQGAHAAEVAAQQQARAAEKAAHDAEKAAAAAARQAEKATDAGHKHHKK